VSDSANDSQFFVIADNPILVGLGDGFSWIRFEGKGSFANSSAVKAFGEQRIAAGETCVVVDLGGCTGMDSTFMGTLAGLAVRLSALAGGGLQIAAVDERNRRSLEDLGLDFLMAIDPPTAAWRGAEESIRNGLVPPQATSNLIPIQRARQILEAHQMLAGMSEENSRQFHAVVSLLENEVADKEKLAQPEEST